MGIVVVGPHPGTLERCNFFSDLFEVFVHLRIELFRAENSGITFGRTEARYVFGHHSGIEPRDGQDVKSSVLDLRIEYEAVLVFEANLVLADEIFPPRMSVLPVRLREVRLARPEGA